MCKNLQNDSKVYCTLYAQILAYECYSPLNGTRTFQESEDTEMDNKQDNSLVSGLEKME